MKRPKKAQPRFSSKPKVLEKNPLRTALEEAAVHATYAPSPYHCVDQKTGRPKGRAKPAMLCPAHWTKNQAKAALREAIRAGQVSRRWIGKFPRHVWHNQGDMWYEARTCDGTPGEYHAYPIEPSGLPPGLE